jgi:FkbM family methyltransferase
VVAFEPEPSHVGSLLRTFRAEIDAGSVEVVNAAVGDQEGQGGFICDGVASRLTGCGELNVRVTTVDRAVRDLNVSSVDFIKADIEGAERYALLGASETIRRYRPRMAICTYHLPDDPGVIRDVVLNICSYRSCSNLAGEQMYFWPKP